MGFLPHPLPPPAGTVADTAEAAAVGIVAAAAVGIAAAAAGGIVAAAAAASAAAALATSAEAPHAPAENSSGCRPAAAGCEGSAVTAAAVLAEAVA